MNQDFFEENIDFQLYMMKTNADKLNYDELINKKDTRYKKSLNMSSDYRFSLFNVLKKNYVHSR